MNKCHSEKKEQIATEKNAQAHQQKVDNMGSFMAAKEEAEESGDSEITQGISSFTRISSSLVSFEMICGLLQEMEPMKKKKVMMTLRICNQNQNVQNQEQAQMKLVR